jgi:hypothetical protein
LKIIQRELGHADLGTTSVYLQGIDPEEQQWFGCAPLLAREDRRVPARTNAVAHSTPFASRLRRPPVGKLKSSAVISSKVKAR